MNYYIQGNSTKSDKIKAAFEELGYDTSFVQKLSASDSHILFTLPCDTRVHAFHTAYIEADILKRLVNIDPDYKELELPIEPKFKVGDWIVRYDEFGVMIRLVDKLLSKSYLLLDKFGVKYNISFYQQDGWHLWTIADAKDGDVLVNGGFIFIFKNIDDGNGVHYYCAYEIRSHEEYEQFHIACFNSLMGRIGNSYTHYIPATKEQSALLFQKMGEAGYEWDEKEKELRKIKPHYNISNFSVGMPVLVRNSERYKWELSFYGRYNEDSRCGYNFHCVNGSSFSQCIPFKDNAHLLGTTDMCPEEYINW